MLHLDSKHHGVLTLKWWSADSKHISRLNDTGNKLLPFKHIKLQDREHSKIRKTPKLTFSLRN
jgi:hypothetical protein